MNEELVVILSARRYMYRLFHHLFGAVPEAELFRAVDLDLVGQALDIMGIDETVAPAAPALLRTLRLAQGEDDRAENLRDRLASEYNRCFVGPRDLPAPPFESVYRDRKRIIMTETTLRVRMAYKASGYEPVLIHHVADDHIALELDFLASLADHAVDCAVAGSEDTAREYLKTNTYLETGEKLGDCLRLGQK